VKYKVSRRINCQGKYLAMPPIVLTAEQRKEVDRRRKKTLDRRVYERLTAVAAVAAGHTPEEVAHLLGTGIAQLNQWLRLFLDDGLEALCTPGDGEPSPSDH
jgi:Homeodomain-like domain